MSLYVQYGCGIIAPQEWLNFDASPTLRMQKIPLIGAIAKRKVDFPTNVKYGDIVKGLPGIEPNSCDAVYCAHVLEHLALNDFHKALNNTYTMLKNGGIFRCVLPDLEWSINQYITERGKNNTNASTQFLRNTMLGIEERPKSLKEKLITAFGNSGHLWMWDAASLKEELIKCGFVSIRKCYLNDSCDPAFKLVEEESRFYAAIAFECSK